MAEYTEDYIIRRESGGKPYIGYGGVDLSNAPLDKYGFPIWEGRMGPQGISHAAGIYQFQPGTWAPYAKQLGITDFSPESQKRVYDAARAAEGDKPWRLPGSAATPGGVSGYYEDMPRVNLGVSPDGPSWSEVALNAALLNALSPEGSGGDTSALDALKAADGSWSTEEPAGVSDATASLPAPKAWSQLESQLTAELSKPQMIEAPEPAQTVMPVPPSAQAAPPPTGEPAAPTQGGGGWDQLYRGLVSALGVPSAQAAEGQPPPSAAPTPPAPPAAQPPKFAAGTRGSEVIGRLLERHIFRPPSPAQKAPGELKADDRIPMETEVSAGMGSLDKILTEAGILPSRETDVRQAERAQEPLPPIIGEGGAIGGRLGEFADAVGAYILGAAAPGSLSSGMRLPGRRGARAPTERVEPTMGPANQMATPPETVRFWHAGKMDKPGSMPYIARDRTMAEAHSRPGAKMYYVDLPANHPDVLAHPDHPYFQASEDVGRMLREEGSAAEAPTPEAAAGGGGGGTPPPPTEPPGPPRPPDPGERPPAAPRGKFAKAWDTIKETAEKTKREIQIFATPMATGPDAMVRVAKDFANAERLARFNRMHHDKLLQKFNPQQWREMWDAMDQASVAAQTTGRAEDGLRYLEMLEPAQRNALMEMEKHGIGLWEQMRDAGMVTEDAERLPFYVTRGLVRIGEDGSVMPIMGGGESPRNINPIGTNVRTRGVQSREYLTVEETEAAARAKFGEDATVVRDIRTLPLTFERVERALAGRKLINEIKGLEATIGRTVVEHGTQFPNSFTIDHPAFKTYRPRFTEVDGRVVPLRGNDGNIVFEQVPIYVSREFEGPLRAVLRSESGMAYRGVMALKSASTSLIMNSPLIHNMVEWGRALPAMPGKVATGRIYFIGNRVRNDVETMRRAVGEDGLVPLGRGYQQDITGIAEADPVGSHRGMLSRGVGMFSETAARGIDKAGRFWHETLLWDRIADLQAGLYSEIRTSLIAKGVDPSAAGKMAAHFANRYAGALPNEAMGEMAKKILNVVFFSRSFTMGNLGVMKDMVNGLPRDVRVSIGRDLTELETKAATSIARRKAMGIFALDIALAYVGNALLQTGLEAMKGDDVVEGYRERLLELMNKANESPFEVFNPLNDAFSLLPQSEHEPGKENRVELGRMPDGTAIYGRLPTGKVGEEFVGWLTTPRQMLTNKEGTLARPLTNIMKNDRGFGRQVFDPEAKGVTGMLQTAANVAFELIRAQFPEGQIQGAIDAIQGRGGVLPYAQMVGPLLGMGVSKGAPGGPAVGVKMTEARRMQDLRRDTLPKVKRLVEDGKVDEARDLLTRRLAFTPRQATEILRQYEDPQRRLNPRFMKQFHRGATPEEERQFQRQMNR